MTHGQKAYNGVAILSTSEPIDVAAGLPGDDNDEQARYLEATIGGVRIASIYLPNGNPLGSEKFIYKLDWMERCAAPKTKATDEIGCSPDDAPGIVDPS